MERYFAYGSNMSSARLGSRIADARALGRARLPGYAWRCDKLGADGTAKANLIAWPGASVWGVLFRVGRDAWHVLDRLEGGYRRVRVEVETGPGARLSAFTYLSERRTADPRPRRSYHLWMLDGAREHGLPRAWLSLLEAHPVRREPDHSAGCRSSPSKGGA
ncbi:MAG: gamma-glutamylcyclotransferase family protein [Myxococcota bacterium]|nr:gamma-glutamylcyclotransferase family protein [Myxococcota bacterium]